MFVESFKSLGFYNSPITDSKGEIFRSLERMIEPVCSEPMYCEVRFGLENAYGRAQFGEPNSAQPWHKDNAGKIKYIAVWCDKYPTELRFCDSKQEVIIQPYELVFINNFVMEHRISPKLLARKENAGIDMRRFAVFRTFCPDYLHRSKYYEFVLNRPIQFPFRGPAV